MWISGYALKIKKFSTLYPQNVENLRKLKMRWIVWIKNERKHVDNVKKQHTGQRLAFIDTGFDSNMCPADRRGVLAFDMEKECFKVILLDEKL